MTRTTASKLLAVGAIVAAATITLVGGGFDALRDQDRVEELLTDSGPWGPIVYIMAFVALQPFSLPGAVLIIPATFVWSWWEVALYSVAGGMVASSVGFVLARWLARDWVEQRLPDRFRPWRQRLVEHELAAIVALRILTGYAPAADWFLGVSPVRVRAFVVGTVVGLTPTTVAMSVWGDDAVRGLADSPLLGLVIIAAFLAVGAGLYHLRQRSLEVSAPAETAHGVGHGGRDAKHEDGAGEPRDPAGP